jgi:hypothetical protein
MTKHLFSKHLGDQDTSDIINIDSLNKDSSRTIFLLKYFYKIWKFS